MKNEDISMCLKYVINILKMADAIASLNYKRDSTLYVYRNINEYKDSPIG